MVPIQSQFSILKSQMGDAVNKTVCEWQSVKVLLSLHNIVRQKRFTDEQTKELFIGTGRHIKMEKF